MNYFADRRQRMKIGASEIAAAIGEGHYQTPRELAASWNEPDDKEQTDAMRMGQLIEGPIVTMLQERGMDVAPWPQDKRATHPDFPSIEITPDAFGPAGVVECKCLRAYHEDAIADAVAGRFRGAMRQYAIQAIAQAHIVGASSATLAIWCDGTLHVIPVEADDLPSGEEVCQRAEAFMARLAAGEEQPIHRRYEWARPKGEEDETDETGLVERYMNAKAAAKDADDLARQLAAEIAETYPMAKRISDGRFRLTRVTSSRKSVAWAKVAEEVGAPPEVVERHTSESTSDYFRASAVKGAK